MAVGGEVHAAGEFRFERVDEGFAVCVITGPAYVGALLQTEREQAIAKRGAHVLPGFNWSSQHAVRDGYFQASRVIRLALLGAESW